jgi:acyl-CoA dehydrogenase
MYHRWEKPMDFKRDAELDAFRMEIRAFLRDQLSPDLAGSFRKLRRDVQSTRHWQSILNARGWGAPSWAKADGGAGWTASQCLIFGEECAAAGAPPQDGFGQRLVGPVLNHFGTPEQKAEHTRHILSGERLWCQGFSEPGSGSDLASLRTRGELTADGAHYIVSGQKIWTSYAHHADWIFLLVRTDPSVKKQAGITFLILDMRSAGITVRPIRTIDGEHHVNEVFFDDVRVPVENRIGAEGQGWAITKFLLDNEHVVAAEIPLLLQYARQLRALFAAAPVVMQSTLALHMARMEGELEALSIMACRVVEMEEMHDRAAAALGSILKLRGTELQQRMTELSVTMLGDYGAVAYPRPDTMPAASNDLLPGGELAEDIASDMLFRRASTIYGGASEIQRGIIARALFGF